MRFPTSDPTRRVLEAIAELSNETGALCLNTVSRKRGDPARIFLLEPHGVVFKSLQQLSVGMLTGFGDPCRDMQ